MSLAVAVMRKAIGKGTSIGCTGWLPSATAVGEPLGGSCKRRRENASMGPALSDDGPDAQQAACRLPRMGLAGLLAALAGCLDAPLSTLEPSSAGARHVADLWQAMAWGSLCILLLMLALVIVAVARGGDGKADVSLRRGHWLLFGGGVLFPVSVMAAMLVYAYGLAPSQQDAGYRVQVTGHQWWWEVGYPDAPGGARYSVNEMHVPAGVAVSIEIRSVDVIHSFWVPKLGGKMDAVPGRTNRIIYAAPEPGVYHGTCAEYCGTGHAVMHLRVVAHTQEQFDEYLSDLPGKTGGLP